MRTPILTTSLLLGSCLACGAALAQQTAAPATTQPTASTTIVVTQEETPAAGTPAEARPTASTTIVVSPAPAPAAVAVEVQPTASTTIMAAPPSTPLPPGFQPAVPGADPVIDAATYQKRTEFDNTPYRFNMEQNGKRMTADEFSAWMEARGVRVARGPLPHRPENPTMDNRPGQGSTRPVGVRQDMVLAPMPAAVATPSVPVPATQAMPAGTAPAAATTTALPPTGLQSGVMAPGTLQPDTLAPGSVAPTDEWTEDGVPAAPTASTTIVVPADPATVEGVKGQ